MAGVVRILWLLFTLEVSYFSPPRPVETQKRKPLELSPNTWFKLQLYLYY